MADAVYVPPVVPGYQSHPVAFPTQWQYPFPQNINQHYLPFLQNFPTDEIQGGRQHNGFLDDPANSTNATPSIDDLNVKMIETSKAPNVDGNYYFGDGELLLVMNEPPTSVNNRPYYYHEDRPTAMVCGARYWDANSHKITDIHRWDILAKDLTISPNKTAQASLAFRYSTRLLCSEEVIGDLADDPVFKPGDPVYAKLDKNTGVKLTRDGSKGFLLGINKTPVRISAGLFFDLILQ